MNLNVGILGHIDSGKTSLAKALSTIASTAAFDKNPQSQSRGVTLDLGFSSFSIPTPENLKKECNFNTIQYTLVDCPGHASLLKTIIGGAQIIDMMLLVIDAVKGIQTQTAECLVIGEITCKTLMVILTKIDLFAEEKREILLDKAIKKVKTALSKTLFRDSPVVCVSANPCKLIGIQEAINEIAKFSFIPNRSQDGPFLLSVDHCFQIKGQGAVMTGTVLNGSASINDLIEIPNLNITKKIKSIQIFKESVHKASQGDRVAICVTQFDSKMMERGLVCTPGYASHIHCCIIQFNRIKHFKAFICSKSKYHITLGHITVMGIISLFQSEEFSTFSENKEYEYIQTLDAENLDKHTFAVLEFEKPVIIVDNGLLIGSKLDMDIHTNACRLAFWGKIVSYTKHKNYKTNYLQALKIYKRKKKEGVLERYIDEDTIIVKNMFKKETNLQNFIGLNVETSTGVYGKIDGTFGKSGKIKVLLNTKNKEFDAKRDSEDTHIKVLLNYKQLIYDPTKKIHQ